MKERVIKFRGKRIDNGNWVYGSLIEKEGYSAIIIFDKGADASYNAYLELEVTTESVGQSIEMKAESSPNLFEKDVLLHNGKQYHVEYASICCLFVARNIKTGNILQFNATYGDDKGLIDSRFQLLGNSIDKPQLLKK